MTGPPTTKRTRCPTHHGVPVMRPSILLRLDLTATAARGTCAERSTGCDAPATRRSGCRVRAPAPPAVGRRRSGSGNCNLVTPANRGLVVGGSASACLVPDADIPTAVADRDLHVTEPNMEAVRAEIPWHRPVRSTRAAGVSSGRRVKCLTPAPSRRARRRCAVDIDARADGTPRSTARLSRDRRDPTCTACRGDGLGVRLRRRRTQAHDEMPPRRAVREGPIFAHGVRPGGNGASPPHRTWPSRSPCR